MAEEEGLICEIKAEEEEDAWRECGMDEGDAAGSDAGVGLQ